MHAYLLIGQNSNFESQITNLAKEHHAKIMNFPLSKIDDTRSLNNLIRLSFSEPTLIVLPNIHQAGEEALNAFLKNLEEPQENIFFVLTAPTTRKVLPTILSRCQIIRVGWQDKNVESGDSEKFMTFSVGEKLAFTDKIKDRQKAVEFTENLVNFLHEELHFQKSGLSKIASNLEIVNKTLTRLKANGNVTLNLTNMIAGLS